MATETVRIDLPEEMYQRLKEMATETHRPLQEVIYQTIRGNLPPTLNDLPAEQRDLLFDLQSMSDEALWAVAREPLPASHWAHHRRLLRRAEVGDPSDAEREQLEELRKAADRFVIRRSYALALLNWRGHTIPASM